MISIVTGDDDVDIDFVIGEPEQRHDDDLLETGPSRTADRRWVLGLVVATLVVTTVIAAVRLSGGGQHARTQAGHTVPVVPTFASLPASSEAQPTPVALTSNLCLPERHCFSTYPGQKVSLGIRAALRQAFGGASHVKFRDVAIDRATDRLFAREITATTPRGRVRVQAAAVSTTTNLGFPGAPGPGIGSQTYVDGFAVGGGIGGRPHLDLNDLGDRLHRFLNDDRLVARG